MRSLLFFLVFFMTSEAYAQEVSVRLNTKDAVHVFELKGSDHAFADMCRKFAARLYQTDYEIQEVVWIPFYPRKFPLRTELSGTIWDIGAPWHQRQVPVEELASALQVIRGEAANLVQSAECFLKVSSPYDPSYVRLLTTPDKSPALMELFKKK